MVIKFGKIYMCTHIIIDCFKFIINHLRSNKKNSLRFSEFKQKKLKSNYIKKKVYYSLTYFYKRLVSSNLIFFYYHKK